jgi:UDP-N-acetylglucosamine diphosphorylase/glucosamine-1-phosphate N-acetyltransferase
MEGSMIRGPFSLGDHAVIKMGAKMYGPTTIGPHCKVGGEVNNSVFFGYSNKAHDGFIGNSVIGEWCNIGADTNTSNLKNTYDYVKLWNYADQTFVETGQQFCGLIMGDHSKCGINTMFNTGTVVGISANIFGSGYQRNFIPGFVWGGVSGYRQYQIDRAVETARSVYKRRGLEFDATEEQILRDAFQLH